MKKLPPTFKHNLKRRTSRQLKKSTVIKRVPQIPIIFNLCSMQSLMSLLLTISVAVACTRLYWIIRDCVFAYFVYVLYRHWNHCGIIYELFWCNYRPESVPCTMDFVHIIWTFYPFYLVSWFIGLEYTV